MDALKVLRREHTRIAQLFAEFDGLSDCACTGRRALVRELDELVRRHVEVEEALIYQGAAQAPDDHCEALRLLDEIAQTECHTPEYVPRVHALRDMLLAHIEEEEAHVFPACAGYAQVA
jgi:hemerythrin superfamily protein